MKKHEIKDVEGRRGLKFTADKSTVMVLGGEKGLVCQIYVDGACSG